MSDKKDFQCPLCGQELDRYDFPDETGNHFCNWYAFVEARHQHLLAHVTEQAQYERDR